jgi:hypothetical protein
MTRHIHISQSFDGRAEGFTRDACSWFAAGRQSL